MARSNMSQPLTDKLALVVGGALGWQLLTAILSRALRGHKEGKEVIQPEHLKHQRGSGQSAVGCPVTVVDKPEDVQLNEAAWKETAEQQQQQLRTSTPEEWRREAGAQLKRERQAAQQYTNQLEAKLRSMQHERKKVNSEVLKARDVVAATELQLEAALEQIAVLQSRTMTVMSEKKSVERSSKELKTQLGSSQLAAASKERTLQQQVERLQARLAKATFAEEAAESQLHALQKQVSQQQHRQQQAAASLQRAQAEAEAARQQAEEMRRAYHTLQEELESERSTHASSEAQLAAAQHDPRRLQAEVWQACRSSPTAREGLPHTGTGSSWH